MFVSVFINGLGVTRKINPTTIKKQLQDDTIIYVGCDTTPPFFLGYMDEVKRKERNS